jgi:tetratricopeptide (TPR) repeat protein
MNFATHLSNAYLQLGLFQDAINVVNQYLPLTKQLQMWFEVSVFLMHLGTAYANLGKYNEGLKYFEEAAKNAEALGDNALIGRAFLGIGQCLHNLVKYEDAQKYYEVALEKVAQSSRSKRTEATIYGNLAHIIRSTGKINESIDYYKHSLSIDRKIGYRRAVGSWLGGMGVSFIELGQPDQAIRVLHEALQITQEIDDRKYESNWMCRLGYAHIVLAEFQVAKDYLMKGLALASRVKNAIMVNYGSGYLAHTFLCLDEPEAASGQILTAQEYDIPRNNHCLAAVAGVVFGRLGDIDHAAREFERAIREANQIISQTPKFFKAHYAKGIAYAGLSAISKDSESDLFLNEARQSMSDAKGICSAAGVIIFFKQELEQIELFSGKAGVKQLLE